MLRSCDDQSDADVYRCAVLMCSCTHSCSPCLICSGTTKYKDTVEPDGGDDLWPLELDWWFEYQVFLSSNHSGSQFKRRKSVIHFVHVDNRRDAVSDAIRKNLIVKHGQRERYESFVFLFGWFKAHRTAAAPQDEKEPKETSKQKQADPQVQCARVSSPTIRRRLNADGIHGGRPLQGSHKNEPASFWMVESMFIEEETKPSRKRVVSVTCAEGSVMLPPAQWSQKTITAWCMMGNIRSSVWTQFQTSSVKQLNPIGRLWKEVRQAQFSRTEKMHQPKYFSTSHKTAQDTQSVKTELIINY